MKIQYSKLRKHLTDKSWYYIDDPVLAEQYIAWLLLCGCEQETGGGAYNRKVIKGKVGYEYVYIMYQEADPDAANDELHTWQIQTVRYRKYMENKKHNKV